MNKIFQGDVLEVLKTLESESVDCIITSPPYFGLRDYGVDGQIGLEETPEAFVQSLVEVFRESKRVLKKEGTLWVNLGDSYSSGGRGQGGRTEKQLTNKGSYHGQAGEPFKLKGWKPKQLLGIPWRVAFALQADGWYLRQDIIWHKPNVMPESCTDRFTKSHEYIFLLSKERDYYFEQQFEPYAPASDVRYRQALRAGRSYDSKEPYKNNTPYAGKFNVENAEALGSPRARYKRGTGSDASRGDDADGLVVGGFNPEGRNKRNVWSIPTKPLYEAHFATFPEELIQPMILAGCPPGGIVLDPFIGAGTTAVVALKLGRKYIGIDLNPTYIEMAEKRISGVTLPLLVTT